jgi:hypothetical protein
MYYARGIRDLLLTTQLNLEFFDHLTEFQLHYIEMCFKQSIDEKMGLMTDIEQYNYHLFEEYKAMKFQQDYGIDEDIFKKVG